MKRAGDALLPYAGGRGTVDARRARRLSGCCEEGELHVGDLGCRVACFLFGHTHSTLASRSSGAVVRYSIILSFARGHALQ